MTESIQFTVPAAADAVAAVIGDREFIVQGDRRFTYGQIVERSNRLAAYLHSRGLGCHTERAQLPGHEVGQDLLGGKSPGVVGFRALGLKCAEASLGVSLPVLGWAIA